jgi:hypothetical protein
MTRIPGDLDRPDEFLFGLTARQLVLLAPAFIVLAVVAWLGVGRVPVKVLVCVEAVGVGAAIALTVIRQDGMTADRLGKALASYLRRPRHLIWAPEGTGQIPKALRLGRRAGPRVGRFVEPWHGFARRDIDLGDDGRVRVLAVSSLDLQLRSDRETGALTGAYGRLLNALDERLSILVRAELIDLEDRATALESCGGQPGGRELAAYRVDHAAFLRSMSGGLRRQVYLVVRGKDAHALDARCSELLTLLIPMGLAVRELEGSECVALLARATGQPVPLPGSAEPGQAVTSGGTHAMGR